MEYLDYISKTDEHFSNLNESYECCGFKDVGTLRGIMKSAIIAGSLQGVERLLEGADRDWNANQTKCIELGDHHCEWKVSRENRRAEGFTKKAATGVLGSYPYCTVW